MKGLIYRIEKEVDNCAVSKIKNKMSILGEAAIHTKIDRCDDVTISKSVLLNRDSIAIFIKLEFEEYGYEYHILAIGNFQWRDSYIKEFEEFYVSQNLTPVYRIDTNSREPESTDIISFERNSSKGISEKYLNNFENMEKMINSGLVYSSHLEGGASRSPVWIFHYDIRYAELFRLTIFAGDFAIDMNFISGSKKDTEDIKSELKEGYHMDGIDECK